jgi:hypothetical protein
MMDNSLRLAKILDTIKAVNELGELLMRETAAHAETQARLEKALKELEEKNAVKTDDAASKTGAVQ